MSNSQKSANQFNFHPKYNLITGDNNSIGKSTLAKLLLWTLGCSTHHDPTWKSFDIRALLVFNVGDNEYAVGRYNDIIYLKQPRVGKNLKRSLVHIQNYLLKLLALMFYYQTKKIQQNLKHLLQHITFFHSTLIKHQVGLKHGVVLLIFSNIVIGSQW